MQRTCLKDRLALCNCQGRNQRPSCYLTIRIPAISFLNSLRILELSIRLGKVKNMSNPGTVLRCASLNTLVMGTSAQQKLRIILLAVYIPLSVSVGMLHSDDLCGGGSGSLIVEKQSAQSLTRSLESGFCFACLFTAGHIIQHEPLVPVLSPSRAIGFTSTPTTPIASPQPHPARAPPIYSLQ
jgi:hypothetical protein